MATAEQLALAREFTDDAASGNWDRAWRKLTLLRESAPDLAQSVYAALREKMKFEEAAPPTPRILNPGYRAPGQDELDRRRRMAEPLPAEIDPQTGQPMPLVETSDERLARRQASRYDRWNNPPQTPRADYGEYGFYRRAPEGRAPTEEELRLSRLPVDMTGFRLESDPAEVRRKQDIENARLFREAQMKRYAAQEAARAGARAPLVDTNPAGATSVYQPLAGPAGMRNEVVGFDNRPAWQKMSFGGGGGEIESGSAAAKAGNRSRYAFAMNLLRGTRDVGMDESRMDEAIAVGQARAGLQSRGLIGSTILPPVESNIRRRFTSARDMRRADWAGRMVNLASSVYEPEPDRGPSMELARLRGRAGALGVYG